MRSGEWGVGSGGCLYLKMRGKELKNLDLALLIIFALLPEKCGWRDSNSQAKGTRPSNVRVYQFRHIR